MQLLIHDIVPVNLGGARVLSCRADELSSREGTLAASAAAS
jgi:hypothetical protein